MPPFAPASRLLIVAAALLALVALTACSSRPVKAEDDAVDARAVLDMAEMDGRTPERDGTMQHLLNELDHTMSWQRCVELGDEAWNAGDMSTALALYEEAFDRGRVDPDLLTRIGWCWQPVDPERAIHFYDLAIGIKPDQWDAHFNRANSYFQLRQLTDTRRRVRSGPFDYHLDPDVIDLSTAALMEEHDRNRDGSVAADEFMGTPTEFAEIDVNPANGTISRDEMRALAASDGRVEVTRGALYYYNLMVSEQERAGVPVYPLAYYNRAHCFYMTGSYWQARRNYMEFYEKGGATTEYATRALQWIRTLEDELCIKPEHRYQPGPATQ